MRKHQIWQAVALFSVLLVVLADTGCVSHTPPTTSREASGLFCRNSDFDFGLHRPSGQVSHIFRVHNNSDRTARIVRAVPTCNCVSVKLGQRSIAPHGTCDVRISVNMAVHRGRTREGAVLTTGGAVPQHLALWLDGWSAHRMSADPRVAFFGQISPRSRVRLFINLDPGSPRDSVKATSLTVTGKQFSATLEDHGGTQQVAIEPCDEPLPIGELRAVVRVYKSGNSSPILRIPVWADVVGPLAATPTRIRLSVGEMETVRVSVRPLTEEKPKLTRVVFPPGTEVGNPSIRQIAPGYYSILIPRLLGTAAINNKPIDIYTPNSDEPVLQIPVTVRGQLLSSAPRNPRHGYLKWKSQSVHVAAGVGRKSVTVRFHFKNDGPTRVRILRIAASCGCTTARANASNYAPGQRGTLTVVVMLGKSRGRFQKAVFVHSTDYVNPMAILYIHIHRR